MILYRRRHRNGKPGHIYVMSNPCFRYLKIGSTMIDPEERRRHLSSSTAIPFPFKLEYAILVFDVIANESNVHDAMRRYRVGKEFFDIAVDEAIHIIDGMLPRLPERFDPKYARFNQMRKAAEIDLGIVDLDRTLNVNAPSAFHEK